MNETFVTRIMQKKGRRAAERRQLHVPWECAIGEYEHLSHRQLVDLRKDLDHEYRRRNGEEGLSTPTTRRFDPYATQILEDTDDA